MIFTQFTVKLDTTIDQVTSKMIDERSCLWFLNHRCFSSYKNQRWKL